MTCGSPLNLTLNPDTSKYERAQNPHAPAFKGRQGPSEQTRELWPCQRHLNKQSERGQRRAAGKHAGWAHGLVKNLHFLGSPQWPEEVEGNVGMDLCMSLQGVGTQG